MYKKFQSNLDQKMLDINIDLHSFYSNKEDYIDEITKQNNPNICLLYTSPSPRDDCPSRMPSSA